MVNEVILIDRVSTAAKKIASITVNSTNSKGNGYLRSTFLRTDMKRIKTILVAEKRRSTTIITLKNRYALRRDT